MTTAGTLYSPGRQAGDLDEDVDLPNRFRTGYGRFDAAATIVGAALGTSGHNHLHLSQPLFQELLRGRTGLTAVVVGILMLSGLFLSGLFQAIPTFAMACARVIGAMMMKQLLPEINWDDKEVQYPPAFRRQWF